MHLASQKGKQAGSVLIWIGSHVEYYADAFVRLLEEDWAGQDLPTFFEKPPAASSDHDLYETALKVAADYFGDRSSEYKLLRLGIALHHGKMPAPMARAVKNIVERGVVRIILATATLSEGVNLPVEYVLLPELRRGKKRLSGAEIANVIGRAGRPGCRTEGVALAIFRPNDSRQYIHDHYQAIKAELEAGITKALPSSSLAQLLRELRGEWGRISNSSSDAEFEAWLENIAPEEIRDETLAGLIESLDLTVLAGVEELAPRERPAEAEERLKALWRSTYAYVASGREATLEKWFGLRARGVAARYDGPTRRKFYRCSLPIRTARSVEALIGEVRAHLHTAAEYVSWTAEQRLAFVIRYAELLGSVPRFAFDEKAGKRRMDWKAVLSWWLAPGTGGPSPKDAGAWHSYISKNFIYRLLWAHGSAVQLIAEMQPQVADGLALVRGSFDDWSRLGLPWSMLWLRDLITWGTLEPVAAHLLIEKLASTRRDALDACAGYFESASRPYSDSLYDPRTIAAWSSGAARPYPACVPDFGECDVKLAANPAEYAHDTYRVLPVRRDCTVEWRTYAGFLVARSEGPAPDDPSPDSTYILVVSSSTVVSMR